MILCVCFGIFEFLIGLAALIGITVNRVKKDNDMGYTTTFVGDITFNKNLTEDLKTEINKFCEKRHCKGNLTSEGYNIEEDYAPSLWCNWEVSEEGNSLRWNESEKSYSMDKWLEVIIDKFLIKEGVICNGTVLAYGENPGDVWRIRVVDNKVKAEKASFLFDKVN